VKKIIVMAAILVLPIIYVNAQTYLKWNGLYFAAGVINTSIETKLSDKLSFNTDAVFSPWKSINGNPFLIGQLIPEVRYYPRGTFNGFYMGAYAGGHMFKLTKWNYINRGKYQKGWGYSLGLSLGYEIRINNRWMMDVYAGYGYQHSEYKGYMNHTGEQYIGWNGSGEWIPYKIGVAFAYKL